jgi:DsbC/DsbD-like thiol-disulfide interchange protein
MTPETKAIVLQIVKAKRASDEYFIDSKLRDIRYTQETAVKGRSQGARTVAANKILEKQKFVEKLQSELAKLDAAIADLEAT